MNIEGLIGSTQAKQTGTKQISLTETVCQRVSLTEEGADMTREGKRFLLGIAGAITGIAPIQTLGLQVAAFGITNLSTTKTIWIEHLGMVLEAGTAGTTGNYVYATHFTAPVQAGMYAGLSIVNANGGSTSSTNVAIGASVTITTPAASSWFPIASTPDAASVAIGSLSLVNCDLRGKICIQPGKSLGLCTVGATGTTPLFAPYMMWYEQEANFGA